MPLSNKQSLFWWWSGQIVLCGHANMPAAAVRQATKPNYYELHQKFACGIGLNTILKINPLYWRFLSDYLYQNKQCLFWCWFSKLVPMGMLTYRQQARLGHRARSLWAASKIGTVFRVIKWLEKFVVRPQNRECVIVYRDTLKESLNLHSKIG